MNNLSPLIPQGSALEHKNTSRTRVRLAVFVVLSVHIVGLMALLMQGCQKPDSESEAGLQPQVTNDLFSQVFDPTNVPVEAVPPPQTNLGQIPPENAVVPLPTPTSTEYTVMRDDTLSGIAQKFPGVSVRMIQEANPGVEPTRLQIGQKLQIPPPAPAALTPGAPTAEAGGQRIHVVKSGENLIRIAEQYGVSVAALRAENNLTTTRIIVGQKLKIPASAPPTTEPPMTPAQ
jgi:LysM repeat protein